ncbi:uncharacterized protein [Chelonus insularis]|uniref:uncharacterized protein isoform X2 n=1 Tax=Chelonus insularis TaxID=460826 RepID=UPI00158EA2D2|nr:uncharacterized protein LOC118070334 isoform X2 [Chelonus insularis]
MDKLKRDGKKGDGKWINEGYSYYKLSEHKRKDGAVVTSVACIKKNNKAYHCPVTGCFIDNVFHPKNDNHQDAPDPLLLQRWATYKRAKDLSAIRGINAGQIYTTAFLIENNDIATDTPSCNVRRTIQKMIAKSQPEQTKLPPKTNTLIKLIESLTSVEKSALLQYGEQMKHHIQCYLEQVEIKNGSVASNLYLYDEEFFKNICSIQEQHLFIDGTFRCIPQLKEKITQLLTIMVKIENKSTKECKAVPCMWVLMTHKTTECYDKLFKHIQKRFPTFSPSRYMSDYEVAVGNAIEATYPNIQATHCYFHYSQAIMKRARKLKLISSQHNKFTDPDIFIILKQIISLALLEPSQIEITFQQCKKNCLKDFGDFFKNFFVYFEKFWIKKITPSEFSVNNVSDRTNNNIESYHKQLNSKLPKNPVPAQFITTIKQLLLAARMDKIRVETSTYRSRECKKHTRESNKEIDDFSKAIKNINSRDPNAANIILSQINNLNCIKKLIDTENEIIREHMNNIETKYVEDSEYYGEYEYVVIGENVSDTIEMIKYIRRRFLQKNNKKKILLLHKAALPDAYKPDSDLSTCFGYLPFC